MYIIMDASIKMHGLVAICTYMIMIMMTYCSCVVCMWCSSSGEHQWIHHTYRPTLFLMTSAFCCFLCWRLVICECLYFGLTWKKKKISFFAFLLPFLLSQVSFCLACLRFGLVLFWCSLCLFVSFFVSHVLLFDFLLLVILCSDAWNQMS